MKISETLKLLDDKDFLDKIYGFSYHRCNTSHEAEELCSEIILSVVSAISKQAMIGNFYAFVWTVAHRVYADYCRKRNSEHKVVSFENSDMSSVFKDEIDEYIESEAEQEQIKRIFKEIAFLSKAYREVMIMFYIDEMKVKDIAEKLNINETTVKQRLFSARNSVKKEVETMNERNYVLKPIKLVMPGTGNPCGNDPRIKAERMFSQNLVYLCKDKPKTAKELSEELCVPMPFVEEELEIQCRGENGEYGMLRKLDNGKYVTNIHLVDYEEYDEANKIYEKYLPEIYDCIREMIKQNEEKILSVPYLSEQNDIRFIMWTLVSRFFWVIRLVVDKFLAEKYFADVSPLDREFACTAIAFREEQNPEFGSYGCDGIFATSICNYKSVLVSNIYGKQIEPHFRCGHNLACDQMLLMVLKSIGGISIDKLSEDEREIAAKAIKCGYLRQKGSVIEPKIIVIEGTDEEALCVPFFDLENTKFKDEGLVNPLDKIAAELSCFIRTHVPEHMINEYHIYAELIAGNRILDKAIEALIEEGLLSKPENRLGAEGVLMCVER